MSQRLNLAAAAGIGALLFTSGCVVTQFGNDQVPDINVNATELKDEQYTGSMPAAVDTIVAAFLSQPGAPPGCAVGIMIDNEVAHVKGYGLSDFGPTLFTHARPSVVGSISKTWTALAVLRLSELGCLDLNDTIGDHLNNPPPDWQNITIRQRLSHTSGLPTKALFDPSLD